jgi:hypothetical protein
MLGVLSMNHKIIIITLICAVILVSGCTITNSNNSSIGKNNTGNVTHLNLDSKNVSINIPSKITPDTKYNISITLKNTGITSWSSTNVTLSLANDPDNEAALFSNNTTQYFMKPKTVIKSGSNYTWNLTIITPTYPNNYTLIYQLIYDNTTWFGEKIVLNVTNGKYTGPVTFKSNTISKTMVAGSTYKVNIKVNNTGKTTWYDYDKVAFAAVDYDKNNASDFGANLRFYLNPGSHISPGGQAQWNFTMTAPKDPATYILRYRMVKGGSDWFGDTFNITIKVNPTPVATKTY